MSKKLLILGAKGAAKKAIEAMDVQNIYSEIAFLDNYTDYTHLYLFKKCKGFETDVKKLRGNYQSIYSILKTIWIPNLKNKCFLTVKVEIHYSLIDKHINKEERCIP
jgi:FlaA1/EpsC-like NDP-sugar epimerase